MSFMHLSSLLLALSMALALGASAQNDPYAAQWKKINELYQKRGLPKSALAETRKLYARAKAEGRQAEVIRALVYIGDLQEEVREENAVHAIRETEKELAGATGAARSLLQVLLARRYQDLLNEQRYRMYGRTRTATADTGDPTTWSIDDFHQRISSLYQQALAPKSLLVQTRIDAFSTLVTKGNTRGLRPTLYDLIAHRALEYFGSGDAALTRPAYAFEIDDPIAFAPAERFTKAQLLTRDSGSLEQKALVLYRELIALHLTDNRPDALTDVDVDRLAFVHRKSVLDNKDERYRAALERIATATPRNRMTHKAEYFLAVWHSERGERYREERDSSLRGELLLARRWAERAAADSALKTESWAGAMNLLEQLKTPRLKLTLEKVNLPGQPMRALVEYRNLSQVHLRILKATDALKRSFTDYDEERKLWSALASATPLNTSRQALPGSEDLQGHSAEIPLGALPAGEYIVLASDDGSFDPKNSRLTAGLFHVSAISWVSREEDFWVLHRETGRPLAGAAVQLWQRTYDNEKRTWKLVKGPAYTTNAEGYFRRRQPESARNEGRYYRMEVSFATDRLFLNEDEYVAYYNGRNRKEPNPGGALQLDNGRQIAFFTDRSLYRPGQTVYFKGLVTELDGKKKPVVRAGYSTTVELSNANGEVVSEQKFTTNEYGSFSGKFTLPSGGLTGRFSLVGDGNRGYASFNVEEYKRPKFYVQLDTVKGSYRVGDTVQLTGSAIAYAGNNIGGAKITYRVERTPRLLYDWFWWRRSLPRYPGMEITHGEAQTDESGRFTIPFRTIPDRTIDRKLQPVFDYRVQVEITDLNGETRSATSLVSAGYTDVVIRTQIPEKLPADSFRTVQVRTENLSGAFVAKPVTLTIFPLQPEGRLVRNRLWEEPDQFVLSKDAFLRLFPRDEYRNESDVRTWPRGAQVGRQAATTTADGSIRLTTALPPGHYAIEITAKDAAGGEVKDVRYVELFDPRSDRIPSPQYLWVKREERALAPGESAAVEIGSSADVHLITVLDKRDKEEPGTLTINNRRITWTSQVTEEDRGGFGFGFVFVRDNRVYQFNQSFPVPWTNKDLQVRFGTFRDKTLPGAKETWSVTVSGTKGTKVAAELLASMYDASLDQFLPHRWTQPALWPTTSPRPSWQAHAAFGTVDTREHREQDYRYRFGSVTYDELALTVGEYFNPGRIRGVVEESQGYNFRVQRSAGVESAGDDIAPARGALLAAPTMNADMSMADSASGATKSMKWEGSGDGTRDRIDKNSAPFTVQPRKNFNETAFFFPDLRTDAEGNITFSFTLPEALTKWKLQTFAHTKDLAMGSAQTELLTQKPLMVQPNFPRFLRHGDQLELAIKIANLSEKELTGQMQLELFDAATNTPIDGWFMNTFPNQYFTVAAGQSDVVRFPVQVPFTFNSALTWRVTARAGDFSDGEENLLPVLTNKQLVIETLPMTVKGGGTKTFSFDKLKNAKSETLQHQSLTIEYTSNPAWSAVQALPYLMEYPYECSEQIFSRYYANALASRIAGSIPKIRAVLEKWRTTDTAALLSNLQKNEELKTVLLEETPWVFAARSETEQRRNIAQLFDLVRLAGEQNATLEKLKRMQRADGSFPWFPGGPDNRYITQYIVTGIGRLGKLGVDIAPLRSIAQKAVAYLDEEIRDDHKRLLRSKVDMSKQYPGELQVQYLYMRSFFPNIIAADARAAAEYYRTQAAKYWLKQGKYEQGMIAIALHRAGDRTTAGSILRSLKESSVVHEELGRYWKDNAYGRGWYWYQAPIETHAQLIEAFEEVGGDRETVDELRTWLLRNKQTNNWRTTKATADACYALLKTGTDWLSSEPVVTIEAGRSTFGTAQGAEGGTGYFKQTIKGESVRPEMGTITVSVKPANGAPPATTWGAAYWQYFEDMDKITGASTPLQLKKRLYLQRNSDRGPVLTPVEEGKPLAVGDKLVVRIELKTDRSMEYVHLKDTRASGLEPLNVLSGYRYQGGLGYYESTRDANTSFFIDYLPKGSYVFEYSLYVTHSGTFTNGISSIQCMYAPEFSAHSQGGKIEVR